MFPGKYNWAMKKKTLHQSFDSHMTKVICKLGVEGEYVAQIVYVVQNVIFSCNMCMKYSANVNVCVRCCTTPQTTVEPRLNAFHCQSLFASKIGRNYCSEKR